MGVLMAMGRPKAALVLRPEQREQLEGLASSRSLPAGLVSRARIILLSSSGKTNMQIARQMGLTNATVGKWRRRFLEQDVSGVHDELRPGRPRPISDERVAGLVRKTLETKPKEGTHWSIRQMAEQTRIQALERTQPMLPIGLGYVEGVTHDYRRHGTTTLFAALDTAKGTVLHALSATPSASRISGLSAADRQQRAARPRRARDRGQLRDPQAS